MIRRLFYPVRSFPEPVSTKKQASNFGLSTNAVICYAFDMRVSPESETATRALPNTSHNSAPNNVRGASNTRQSASHPSTATPETLQGFVERVTFRNVETGYCVMRLKIVGHRELVTAVGAIGPVSVGEGVVLTGEWALHPEFGRQFQFHHYEHRRPSSAEAVQKYLSSGVITGVGPELARRLVEKFGAETLLVIEFQPARLNEVSGLGEKRIEAIRAGLAQHRAVQDIAIFLQECGSNPVFAERLYRQFGDRAIEEITADPYALVVSIRGIGFRTADQIARSLGAEKDAPARLAAGLVYALREASEDGHVYLPRPQVEARAARILEVSKALLQPLLPGLFEVEKLIAESDSAGGSDRVHLPPFYYAEVGFARRIGALLTAPGRKQLPADRVLEWLDRRRGPAEVALSSEQKDALALVMNERVCVITGGPGAGKSTITRALVRAFETAGRTVALASPTGRAARRLTELTGRPATTLHKLLEYDNERRAFRRDQQSPIVADLVIVDEASMLDILLANSLAKAVAPGAHLALIGDVDQLPSVGPGSVLRDLIISGIVPIARLTHVFRQALGSLTIRNAHKVNSGEIPELIHPSRREGSDCVFLEAGTPDSAVELVCNLLRVSLPRLGFVPDQVQVIAPMNKGPLGVLALNEAVQAVLNPAEGRRPEVSRSGATFRLGDRVIQLVNDYDRDVFNGDVGQVVGIDVDAGALQVAYATLPVVNSPVTYAPDPPRPRFGGRAGRRPPPARFQTADLPMAAEAGVSYDTGAAPGASPAFNPVATRLVEYRFADLDELQLAYAMTVHKAQGSEFPAIILLIHDAHAPMLQRNLLYTALTRGKRLTVLLGSRRAIAQAVSRHSEGARLTSLADRLAAFRHDSD